MDLETVMLNEIRQRRRYMWNLKRNDAHKLLYLQNRNRLRLREWTYGYYGERMGGVIITEFGMKRYILLYFKWITNKALLYSTGNSVQCYVAAWMGGEFGGERMHIYVWLNPFTIHLKLSQHCSSVILQCKIKHVKRKKEKKMESPQSQSLLLHGV